MSQENVEVVRRIYAAFNDGDLETVLTFIDPDIEWNASDVFFDQPRTYLGRRAWQEEFLAELFGIFEDYRGDPEEIHDAGDQVVVVAQVGGRGRRSGARIAARVAHVARVEDGRLVEFTELRDVRKTLEAAGLSE
jgi:ketosteroid isomerase-like protein